MATSLRQQLRCATGPRTRHRPTDETSTTTSTPPLLVPTTVAHRRRRSTRADKAFLQQENNDPGSSAPHARPLRQTNGRVDASTRHHRTSDFSGRPRPPAKLFVARPHGGVFQAVNGVHTALGVRDDDLASLVSTPRTGEGESPPSVGQPVGRPKEDKRTLRSQDGGSRLKSDLSIYFPNYDDVITDAPRNSDLLATDTPIYIVDDQLKPRKSKDTHPLPINGLSVHETPRLSTARALHPSLNGNAYSSPSKTAPLNGAQRLDFTTVDRLASHNTTDPLTDAFYFKAHRRAERKEKQLRNIEKERAMHEKVQLERLLDGLQGYDWLRVMGVTGITDSEKKEFEPKRDYFIREVELLMNKFRTWKEEEKRLKMVKEQAQLSRDDEDEDDEAEEEQEEDENSSDEDQPGADSEARSHGQTTNSSDFDAWAAARQLQQEASFATTSTTNTTGRKKRSQPDPQPLTKLPPSPEKPFLSFYSKPYLRAAAIGRHRHGRKLTAFGLPVPDFVEHEFALPDGYLTRDVIIANARKRRRLRRESKDGV